MYTVEFSLREDGNTHFKGGLQGVKSFFWFWLIKTDVVDEISLTYKLFLRDVSRFDPLIHVNGDNQPKVVTNCRYGIKVLHLASNQKNSDRSRISALRHINKNPHLLRFLRTILHLFFVSF